MNQKRFIIFLIILVVATMYLFITIKDTGLNRVISLIVLSISSYLLGRTHGRIIEAGNKSPAS
jgi:hypothetical protein